MRLNRHGIPVPITVAAVANVAVETGRGTVRRWRRCKTTRRKVGPLVSLHDPTARMRRYGSDTDLLTPHGAGPS